MAAPFRAEYDNTLALRMAVAAETNVTSDAPFRGPYAPYIMRPFLYPISSRFSDGTFGVHYSANAFDVAKTEHAFHLGRALRDARLPPMELARAYLTLAFKVPLPAVGAEPYVLDPNDYSASQAYGAERYRTGAPGLRYPSVRANGGTCAGLFRPALATDVYLLTDSLRCRWDGSRLDFPGAQL